MLIVEPWVVSEASVHQIIHREERDAAQSTIELLREMLSELEAFMGEQSVAQAAEVVEAPRVEPQIPIPTEPSVYPDN